MSNMKKKKLMTATAGILCALSTSSSFVTVLASSSTSNTENVSHTKVQLHKLAYKNDVKTVANTGDEMEPNQFGNEARAWNPEKDGVVKFTAYKLDSAQINNAKTAQAMADEVATAIAGGGQLPYGAAKVGEEVEVDGEGVAQFDDLNPGYYVFVETTKSAIVLEAANPLFVSLPSTTTEGTENREAVHLYPKNKVKTVSVSFSKYLQQHGGTADGLLQSELSGFSLYKGEPGQGTLVADSYQKLTSGAITVQDLEVGKYYFVEESKVPNAKPQMGPSKVYYDADVLNVAGNKLTFEYHSDGTLSFPDGSLLKEGVKVVNYQKPTLEKTVGNTDVGFDEDINYTITSDVPENIAKYTKYEIVDTPAAAIKVNKDSIKVVGVKGDAETPVTHTVEDGANGSIVIKPDLAAVKAGGFTSLKVTYTAQLDHDKATPGVDLSNTAGLVYNNGTGGDINSNDDGGETGGDPNGSNGGRNHGNGGGNANNASVRTYELGLKKTDAGVFNTGAVQNALQGAKFILGKGDKFLKVEQGKYTWVADKTQATEFETGADGTFSIKGLAKGSYTLTEVKAPEGYNLNANPVTNVEIADKNLTGEDAVKVTNSRRPDMPITGTELTVLVLGGLAGATTVAVAVKTRKRRA